MALALFALPVWAQTTSSGHVVAGTAGKKVFVYHTEMGHGEMGKWWQNSDTVKKLQLNDSQIAQLDQIFLDHRLKLIDFGAEMEKQDLKLQTLLDADVPNEGEISTQVDQVLDARGKLEREATTMNLDLRKVLSLPQWRQLKSIRGSESGFGNRFFIQKAVPPGEPGPMLAPPPGASMLPPLPPPGNDSVDEEARP
jgi:Spy/CpxP family protein refolding chaperone